MVLRIRTAEGGRATGIRREEEVTDNDAGYAPSFFLTTEAGKPAVEVHQQSHPLSSLARGGTLLLSIA